MGAPRPIDEEVVDDIGCEEDALTKANLDKLLDLGFSDVNSNRKILWTFKNKIDEAINYLLDQISDVVVKSNPESNQPLTSSVTPIFIHSSTSSRKNASSSSSATHTETSSSSVQQLFYPNSTHTTTSSSSVHQVFNQNSGTVNVIDLTGPDKKDCLFATMNMNLLPQVRDYGKNLNVDTNYVNPAILTY